MMRRRVTRALRDAHLRWTLKRYKARSVPALDIEGYAQRVYEANRAALPAGVVRGKVLIFGPQKSPKLD